MIIMKVGGEYEIDLLNYGPVMSDKDRRERE